MELFHVACLNYEICGAEETFDSIEEYEIYGDDRPAPNAMIPKKWNSMNLLAGLIRTLLRLQAMEWMRITNVRGTRYNYPHETKTF